MYAAVVVMSLPELELVETATAYGEAYFPYIPGLLSFREVPVLLEAFQALKRLPDAVICDGQGIAHPRGFGLAAHLGLLLDLPTVGCAKTRLIGEHRPAGMRKGSAAALKIDGKTVGKVLRTRTGVKPVYVSPGNKLDVESSVKLVCLCSKYRVPEPTRHAHMLCNRLRACAV